MQVIALGGNSRTLCWGVGRGVREGQEAGKGVFPSRASLGNCPSPLQEPWLAMHGACLRASLQRWGNWGPVKGCFQGLILQHSGCSRKQVPRLRVKNIGAAFGTSKRCRLSIASSCYTLPRSHN